MLSKKNWFYLDFFSPLMIIKMIIYSGLPSILDSPDAPWCWNIYLHLTGWFWTRAVLLVCIFQHHASHMISPGWFINKCFPYSTMLRIHGAAPCFAYGFEFWFEYCLLIQRSSGELNLGPWFDPPWSGFEKGPNADFSDGKCIPYYPILVHHGAGV